MYNYTKNIDKWLNIFLEIIQVKKKDIIMQIYSKLNFENNFIWN